MYAFSEIPWRFFATVVLVVTFCALVTAMEDCIVHQDNFCRCSTKNKSLTIDISGLFHYPVVPSPSEPKYTFQFSPCTQVHCGDVTSAEPAVACQKVISQNAWHALGRQSDMKWTISTTSPLKFDIAYKNGDDKRLLSIEQYVFKRNSKFSFEHTNGASSISFRSENTGLSLYTFTVTGSAIAPYSGGHGGGGGVEGGVVGWVLISIAIGAIVLYFVIGGIYMYTRRGARGLEVIPNYGFWTDLPFLIKDGFMFTISPCVKRTQGYREL